MNESVVRTVIIVLLFSLAPSAIWAQSEQKGLAILGEARELKNKAQSKEELDKVLKKYEEALQIFERARSQRGKAVTLNNIGEWHGSLSQYQWAMDYYEKSLAICRKEGLVEIEGITLNNIGDIYRFWGQYEKSLDYFEKSLAISRKAGHLAGEGVTLNNIGGIYRSLGQYEKSVDYYEKSLAIRRRLGDLQGEGITLHNIGELHRALSQYDKALGYYEKSLAICQQSGDVRGEAITLNNIGEVYRAWGKYQMALECQEKSLAIFQRLSDLSGEGDTFNLIGLVYYSWGQYQKAIDCFEESLAISKKSGDPKAEASALANLAQVYKAWGQYRKAIECQDKSLAIFEKLGDPESLASVVYNIGGLYEAWGRYEDALVCYEKSLAIAKELGQVQGQGLALNNIAGVHYAWGEYDRALKHYEDALAIFRKLGDLRNEGATVNNIGQLYTVWGQYEKSLEFCQASLDIGQKLGDRHGQAVAWNNIGELYRDWGQHHKALEYYEKALSIRQELSEVEGVAIALINIGRLYASLGKYEEARSNFQKALELHANIGVSTDWPKILIGQVYLDEGHLAKAEPFIRDAGYPICLGRLDLLKSEYQSALQHYVKALESVQRTHNSDGLFVVHTGIGLSYEGLHNYEKAIDHFREAVEVTEEVREGLSENRRANFYDARVDFIPRIIPYEGLACVLLQSGKVEESFQQTEGTKARAFAEAISRRSAIAPGGIPKHVMAEDQHLNDKLAAIRQGLQKAYEKGSKEGIESFERQVKEVRQERARHIHKLRSEHPLFAATKYPQPMDLQHAALSDNEWVIEYELTDRATCIYLVHGKKIVKAVLKPILRKEIDDLVRKFRAPMELGPEESITQKMTEFDFASGKKLAELLLGDILSELPKDTPIIIIPDDSLGALPFEMLVLNEGGKVQTDKKVPCVTGAEFFGDRNPISYYQSVTALTLARTLGKQQRAGDRTLAMVDPVFSPDDARLLKAVEQKKRAILDKLTGEKLMSFKSELSMDIPRLPLTTLLGESLKKADPGKTDLYEGLRAQKAVLLQKDVTPYRSVVFGTHGYFGKDFPGIQEPVLILTLPDQPEGQDGFLRMTEVMGLRMNCDVAALTACQTGLGRHISGEGTMGMGRAFQYAGAKSVLMSLWSVAEKSSVQLVESFFKHVREGKSKLEALRLARDEIRKAGYDHPFFWAPFILVGEVH